MIYILFLIAHFVGDFLLQNKRIVDWKHQSIWGLLYHTTLVTLSFCLVLFPYLYDWRVITAIGINFVLHTGQDYIKIKTAHRWNAPFAPFALDQIFHIFLALILASWVAQVQPILGMTTPLAWFYTNELFLLFCLGIIIMSYTSDILLYIVRLTRGGNRHYKRNYRAMVCRVSVFSVMFAATYYLFV